MEKKAFYQFLLERYANGLATDEEVQELFAELEKKTDEEEWEEMINQVFLQTSPDLQYKESYWHPVIERILTEKETEIPVRRVYLKRWLVAASVLALLGIGAYIWLIGNSQQQPAATTAKKEIKAGSNGAILTLADGSTVLLDSLNNGLIAEEQGAAAILQDGKLAYKPSGDQPEAPVYNMMTTPRGRQFRMSLPDGTQVWLNAGSSIRYPTAFMGKERKVEITGEAYFEVKQNASQPFVVLAGKAEVQVLGTDFNINAYNDEPSLNTTLLDGSVKVNGTLLRPGQQAKLIKTDQSGYVQVSEGVDINKVMAWKNGRFSFEGATIEEIMRQIERWYDVEVVFEGKKPRVEFEGQMTRNVPLNGLIAVMKRSGVNMRLEGRTLIVLP